MIKFFFTVLMMSAFFTTSAQNKDLKVIAYYSSGASQLDNYDPRLFTHIIYCFGHLKGNRFHLSGAGDTLLIRKMVAMKKRNPQLKVLLSLGGWGGCKTCSDVFSSDANRKEFAESVNTLNKFLKSDGIDLDWEYPTVVGYPGHRFAPEDKQNFTALVKQLRETLGKKQLVTFAAGAFQNFLDSAVEWHEVMKYADFVNLMTYDLVNGYSTVTGHHTSLYSTPSLKESTDNAVTYLLKLGIPSEKLVIGAAFYGRMWENVPDINNGLYQSGKFKSSVNYKSFPRQLPASRGFNYFWDDTANAPFLYNQKEKLFVTYDDKRSISLKTQYAINKKLGGIMFWQLASDSTGGLLYTMDSVKRHYVPPPRK